MHRDFYLNDKIMRTIVVNLGAMERSDVKIIRTIVVNLNLGAMKRSDVPGKAFFHLHEIPPEETTNEERK